MRARDSPRPRSWGRRARWRISPPRRVFVKCPVRPPAQALGKLLPGGQTAGEGVEVGAQKGQQLGPLPLPRGVQGKINLRDLPSGPAQAHPGEFLKKPLPLQVVYRLPQARVPGAEGDLAHHRSGQLQRQGGGQLSEIEVQPEEPGPFHRQQQAAGEGLDQERPVLDEPLQRLPAQDAVGQNSPAQLGGEEGGQVLVALYRGHDRNSSLRAARSIFPLGLWGSAFRQWYRLGTMYRGRRERACRATWGLSSPL